MYLSPTPDSITALTSRDLTQPVTILNLLRFRQIADYSECPDLEPEEPISGEQAYDLYSRRTIPLLNAVGGRATYFGKGGPLLIGPPDVRWDLVLLVEYPSIQAFLDLLDNPTYQAGAGHRTAALEDSRLLPMT